jgi:hypothetical protein
MQSAVFHLQLLQGDCRVTSHRTFRDRHERHALLALFTLRLVTVACADAFG